MAKRQTTPRGNEAAGHPVGDPAHTGTPAPATETAQERAERLHGKGTPTPTRREQEAARKRPIVPTDRKEAARQARSKTAAARERAREGMAAGDDRFLPARERGPQRRFVRDFVDARFSIAEFIMPVLVLVIVLTFIPALQLYGTLAMYGFFIIAVIDCAILGFIVTRHAAKKFGAGKLERGLRWYAAMRAFQLRAMRLPKPQVKRGQFPH